MSIDSAKRSFDVDLISEIDRITKDMDIENNGYPIFWKHIKDKKKKIGEKKFDQNKLNDSLICPMNYLIKLKFNNSRSNEHTLPMEYFFNKFELENNRRQSKKVEELIEKYSLCIYDTLKSDGIGGGNNQVGENNLLLKSEFDELIEDIKVTYIGSNYIGLMSWLIDRAFLITNATQRHIDGKNTINRKTNENKALLLKILYDINPSNVLKIFSKNA